MPRWMIPLLFAFLAGCGGATKVVRLDTGQGSPIVHIPRQGMAPVELGEDEFKQAMVEHARTVPPAARTLEYARRLFGVPERSGWFRYEGRGRRLTLLGEEERQQQGISPADVELSRRYLLWCERTWEPGDCLRLLVDGPVLDGDGRYALAMAIAHGSVLGAMKEELGLLVSPTAVVATVVGALTMYAVLLALPEPVSKSVAVLMTVGAVAYLGWDTVWKLIEGWLVLMEEVDEATSFEEIEEAGEKFGGVMGEKAARAFVMLATVAVGNTAGGMAAAMPTLPGAGQAAVMAEAQLGIRYSAGALAEVESVALGAEGVTLVLAPTAVAMVARGHGGGQAPPPPSGGPGQWVQVEESMSESARNYQAQVTGAPKGYAYRVKVGGEKVDFDGSDQGVLLEAKGTGYATFIDDELNFVRFFKGRDQMLDQAKRQVRAARGTPIRWIVAEEKLAGALKKMFEGARLKIEVVHISPAS